MAIEITARHMSATQDVQNYARQKAEGLIADFPHVEHVHVILDVEKHRHIASVFVQARKHLRTESSESSDRIITSIDKAMDKIEKQLHKLREKIHDHKPAMKREEGERKRAQ
jgi:putative sigma-54 modulation protein